MWGAAWFRIRPAAHASRRRGACSALAGGAGGGVVLAVGGGGSGRSFRWEILGDEAPRGVFIAGGIRPENIAELLSHRPYGVDLASGVESRPGAKDPARLVAFFEELE